MPTRQLTDTLQRSLNLIHHYSLKNISMLIVALDAEKAFNHLETPYLIQLLKSMRFGPNFLRAIQAMYNAPQAQLVINDLQSEDIKLTGGTHQGCLLSPILFALLLEPLAEAIQNTANIAGANIGPNRHVISLFVDNITLSVADPVKSLSSLMPLIKDFGEISGFTINPTKTELYPMCITRAMQTTIQNLYNFRWVTTWRHLGVLNPLHLKDLFKVIYTPLFNRNILYNWSSKCLSWLEWIELIK